MTRFIIAASLLLAASYAAAECPDIQEWTDCGTCTETCEEPDMMCAAVCQEKCQCPRNQPVWHNEKCIAREDCPNTPECPDIQKWTECGSCTKTCDQPDMMCAAVCQEKCQCPRDKPFWHNEMCIAQEDCPKEQERRCYGGQVWSDCQMCPKTCQDPDYACKIACYEGCKCPDEKPIWHEESGQCIEREQCPKEGEFDPYHDPCEFLECPDMTECRLYTAYCEDEARCQPIAKCIWVGVEIEDNPCWRMDCVPGYDCQIEAEKCDGKPCSGEMASPYCVNPAGQRCTNDMVWNDCGSACTANCDNGDMPCTMQCVPRCECPKDKPLWDGLFCIDREKCPKPVEPVHPCERFLCQSDEVCRAYQDYCEEGDDCKAESVCVLRETSGNTVEENPCMVMRCSRGHECRARRTACDANRCPLQGLCVFNEDWQPCSSGMVWNECGAPCSVPTCEEDEIECADVENPPCEPRCECPRDRPIMHGGKCISKDECPEISHPECHEKGMVWSDCASSCPVTCDEKEVACDLSCHQGCTCPRERPYLHDGRCVSLADCPQAFINPCEDYDCAVDEDCRVFQPQCIAPPCNVLSVCVLKDPTNINNNPCWGFPGCMHGHECEVSRTSCDLDVADSDCEAYVPSCVYPEGWMPCTAGREWASCGSSCTLTCENPELACDASCSARCQCPPSRPIWHGNRCIERNHCPHKPNPCDNIECKEGHDCVMRTSCTDGVCTKTATCEERECKGGMVWRDCAPECTRTCSDPQPQCMTKSSCKPMCACPSETPIWHDGWCIPDEECPEQKNPCEGVRCSDNEECRFVKERCATGERCGMRTMCALVDTSGVELNQCYFTDCMRDHECVLVRSEADEKKFEAHCVFPKDWQQCYNGQQWMSCGSDCEKTCDNPEPMCNEMCVPQCQCPYDTPIWKDGRCIRKEECHDKPKPIDPCKNLECGEGMICVLKKPKCYILEDGTETKCGGAIAVCELPRNPCEKLSCKDDEECRTFQPYCVTTPCDEVALCALKDTSELDYNPCAATSCMVGSDCVVLRSQQTDPKPDGFPNPEYQTACVKPKDKCHGFECAAGEVCRLYSPPCPAPPEDMSPEELKNYCLPEPTCEEPKCTRGQTWNTCASSCISTCENPTPVCTRECATRCACPLEAPIWHNGRCIEQNECPVAECYGGQMWNDCASSCVSTCENPTPMCTKECKPRCACPRDRPIWHKDRCIPQRECTAPDNKNPCENVRCPENEECRFVKERCASGERCGMRTMCALIDASNLEFNQCYLVDCIQDHDCVLVRSETDEKKYDANCVLPKDWQQCYNGQQWMSCGSACEKTCDNPDPMCNEMCVPRCQCPYDTPIWKDGRCIRKEECHDIPPGPADLCKNLECGEGMVCVLKKPKCQTVEDGTAQKCGGTIAVCEIPENPCDELSCKEDEECRTAQPWCITTPCNEMGMCSLKDASDLDYNPCAATSCAVGLECVVLRSQVTDSRPGDLPTPEYQTACVKPKDRCYGKCTAGEICRLYYPPCPPPSDDITPEELKDYCPPQPVCEEPKCTRGQTWNTCASSCISTCENPTPVCTRECATRCACPLEAPIWHNGQCIEQNECPGPEELCVGVQCEPGQRCTVVSPGCLPPTDDQKDDPNYCKAKAICVDAGCYGGQMWNDCASSCVSTCENPRPICTKECKQRCACPYDRPIWHMGRCIPQPECTDKKNDCSTKECDMGQVCLMEDVVCKKAPCPPQPTCMDRATLCDEITCEKGKVCKLQDVTCIRAPCLPHPRCVPKEICEQPMVVGPCEALMPSWYYDAEEGQCIRFDYGGCQGNENRFSTKGECERACETVSQDVCYQKYAVGDCDGSFPRWFFNADYLKCQQFEYGGCGGNGNNFETLEDCERTCFEPVDPCKEHRCKDGDICILNEVQCFTTPCPPQPDCVSARICNLRPETGDCEAAMPRWYFNQDEGECLKFTYGGCGGNQNNFDTKGKCERACGRLIDEWSPCEIGRPLVDHETGDEIFCGRGINRQDCPSSHECTIEAGDRWAVCCLKEEEPTDVCHLPKVVGPCEAYIPSWYFNSEEGQCMPFIYGGCEGNDNRFDTKEACQRACRSDMDTCALPMDSGPCEALAMAIRWYHNSEEGRCMTFEYGGCEGNANNFPTFGECARSCQPDVDICQLPKVTGPCKALFLSWYYNSATGTCEEFDYGGCQGNANRFDTMEECESACKEERSPCKSGRPLVNPETGEEYFCRRGPNREDCPSSHECTIEAGDRWAVCCPKDEGGEDGKGNGLKCSFGMPLIDPATSSPQFCGRGLNRAPCPLTHECVVDPLDRGAICCLRNRPCWREIDGKTPMPGSYIAQCTEDGYFKKKQCHGSTGSCWCVTEYGDEIPKSRRGWRDGQVNCDLPKYDAFYDVGKDGAVCYRCSTSDDENCMTPNLEDTPMLACEENICLTRKELDANGKVVAYERTCGDRVECSADDSSCCEGHLCNAKEAQGVVVMPPCLKEIEGKEPMPGAYIAQCTEDGYFKKTQCYGSIGECWCVTKYGEEIPKSRMTWRDGEIDCNLPKYDAFDDVGKGGAVCYDCSVDDEDCMSPTIEDTSTLACEEKTCLTRKTRDASGVVVAYERTCGDRAACPVDDSDCCEGHLCNSEKEAPCWRDTKGKDPMPGSYIAACTEEGYYAKTQCFGSIGACWCSTKFGEEIPESRRSFRDENINCDHPKFAHFYALQGDNHVVCYKCHGSSHSDKSNCMSPIMGGTNTTSCPSSCLTRQVVDEALGTTTVIRDCGTDDICTERGHSTCCNGHQCNSVRVEHETMPPCLKEIEGKEQMPGAYIAQCTEDGYFEKTQCYGSIGECWCVTKYGEEIPKSRMTWRDGQIDCNLPKYDAFDDVGKGGAVCYDCSVDDEDCMSPTIEDTSTLACEEKTCLTRKTRDASGVVVAYERTCGDRAACPVDDSDCCEGHLCNSEKEAPCWRDTKGKDPMPGSYIAACTEEGYYAKTQCFGSIGACWCSTKFGEEIPESRRSFRDENINCDHPKFAHFYALQGDNHVVCYKCHGSSHSDKSNCMSPIMGGTNTTSCPSSCLTRQVVDEALGTTTVIRDCGTDDICTERGHSTCCNGHQCNSVRVEHETSAAGRRTAPAFLFLTTALFLYLC